MNSIALTFIQAGTAATLAILSYLIKRLISRIDTMEYDMNAMKIAFTELKSDAVHRNGFDQHIHTLEEKIFQHSRDNMERRSEIWKELNRLKERFSALHAIQEKKYH